jgi:tRNA(His) guanylyltransferase
MKFNRSIKVGLKHENFQGICSRPKIASKEPNATFDSRAWTIPDPIEVENYFIWRQQDAIRNSVTMLASAYASHKELHGKSASDRHEVIHKAGDNWAKHPVVSNMGA